MNTFSSQDFKQVFGTFEPASSTVTAPAQTGLTLGSITYGPGNTGINNWPPIEWPTTPPPTVSIPPETMKKIEDQLKSTTAIRYDHNKSNWSLMPFEAVEEINKVLEFGAKKYNAHNWKKGEGFKYTRVLNSLLRHVFAYMRGEDKDPESGLSHLAHAGCNILFLLYYEKYKARYKNDDRT